VRFGLAVAVAAVLVVVAVVVGGGGAASAAAATDGGSVQASLLEVLEASRASGKGVMVYVDGHALPGVVTRILGTEGVEMRNRESARIVVRLDAVTAVAGN
jgi:hypothetical protein